VAQFLAGRIGFTAIARLIEATMNAHRPAAVASLAEVRSVDKWAREYSLEIARGVQSKA
jgi:1-deoxy-D-xylulose-5-phosphate reductoisomerase